METIKAFFDKWRLSKTLIVATLIAAFGVLEVNWSLLKGIIPERYDGLGYVLVAVVMAVLRVYTTQPLAEKKELF